MAIRKALKQSICKVTATLRSSSFGRHLPIFLPKSLSIERFFVSDQRLRSQSVKTIFIDVNHGRLNHATYVLTTLFGIAISQGFTPRLKRLSSEAFGTEISNAYAILRDKTSERNSLTLESSAYDFFCDVEFNKLRLALTSDLINEAETRLSKEMRAIYGFLKQPSKNLLLSIGCKNSSDFLERIHTSLHLRRGDLGVLHKRDYKDTHIYEFFKDEICCFIDGPIPAGHSLEAKLGTFQWMSQDYFTILRANNITHAASRYSLQQPTSIYIDECNIPRDKLNLAFSDGFSGHIAFLKNCNPASRISTEEIESIVEQVEFGNLIKAGYQVFAGDEAIRLKDVITVAINSRNLICKESGFPKRFVNIIRLAESLDDARL